MRPPLPRFPGRAWAPMGFLEELKPKFGPETIAGGRTYQAGGRVQILSSKPARVEGAVTGAPGRAAISLGRAKTWIIDCACDAFRIFGPCKHLWALALEANGRDLPVVHARETGATEAGTNGDDDPVAEKHGRKRAGKKRRGGADAGAPVPPAPPPPPPPVPEWTSRVERIRAAYAPPDRLLGSGASVPDGRLVYALAPAAAGGGGTLALEVLCQQPLKRGGWSKGRTWDPAAGDGPAILDAGDEAILAALAGAARIQYGEYQEPVRARGDPRAIEPALMPVLFPLLAATGRLHWRADRQGDLRPLALDDGPPWQAGMALARDAGGATSWLEAWLVRGAERRPAHAAEAITRGGFVVLDGKLARFEDRASLPWLEGLRSCDSRLPVPRADERAVIEALLDSPADPLLTVPDLDVRAAAEPVPLLLVEDPEKVPDDVGFVAARLAFDYGGARVDAAAARAWVRAPDGGWLRRDAAAEARARARFHELGGLPRATDLRGHDASLPLPAFAGIVLALVAEGWTVEAAGRLVRPAGTVRVSVRSGIDWFGLEGAAEFDGAALALPELLTAIRKKQRIVRLGDGTAGILPDEWLRQWGIVEALAATGGGAIRFGRSQAWMLDALLAGRPGVDVDAEFARARDRLRALAAPAPEPAPPGFRGGLRPYQGDALGWFRFLRAAGLGGCLADDMGLGKTIQVLALLEQRRTADDAPGRPSLVVAPRSLVFNWIAEAARFTPELRVLDYSVPAREGLRERIAAADLVVTTYGVLRRDAAHLREIVFDHLVLDEAQAIKNPESLAAKAARVLRGDHRLALSGTPVENHLGELWSIFEFLNPGMLGRSAVFAEAVDARQGLGLDAEGRERLGAALRPFILRRTKEQVAPELPAKTEQTILCELDGPQRRDYEDVREHFRAKLLADAGAKGMDSVRFQVLEALLRLRQAACHPGLIDERRAVEPSAKLEVLLPMLRELAAEGHKALVFSQFTSLLAIVRARLDEEGLASEYLDGATRDREACVRRFQEDAACPFFLISLKAGGLGLNLTAAGYVFILDPWWNPAAEAQAVDRAHRIGQTRPVIAYRLVAKDTVEEQVLELQARKRELADAILASDRKSLRSLTYEDLTRLIG